MADRSTSNWTNLLNNSMELEDTVTLGSKVGVMARPVSREDTKSNNDPTSGLTDILINILSSFSGDVKDLEETKVNSRDVADEVYSKYDILEPIEDPAKARRIGGLTTKNLPMPVDAPVGRQRFSIFPEAAEEEVVEDKVDDGLMSRQVTPEERAALSKVSDDDIGDGLMSSPRPKDRPKGLNTPKVSVSTDKTASNIKSLQQALTDMGYKPNGVDGAVGGGTKRALRKFQSANYLPITGELTQEVADLLTSGTSVVYPDMPVPFAEVEDILTDFNLSVFENEVGKIESRNRYNIKGGSGDHYDGRYQMGKAAKLDAAGSLGITLDHDKASRKAFRNDPDLQDRAFKAYTEKNHKHLTINSEKYRNMTAEEKLGILGYAHNQGATAAEEYLFTGQVGTDAFGTKGTKYTDAIAKAFGN